jgi:hypothetical protein
MNGMNGMKKVLLCISWRLHLQVSRLPKSVVITNELIRIFEILNQLSLEPLTCVISAIPYADTSGVLSVARFYYALPIFVSRSIDIFNFQETTY